MQVLEFQPGSAVHAISDPEHQRLMVNVAGHDVVGPIYLVEWFDKNGQKCTAWFRAPEITSAD